MCAENGLRALREQLNDDAITVRAIVLSSCDATPPGADSDVQVLEPQEFFSLC